MMLLLRGKKIRGYQNSDKPLSLFNTLDHHPPLGPRKTELPAPTLTLTLSVSLYLSLAILATLSAPRIKRRRRFGKRHYRHHQQLLPRPWHQRISLAQIERGGRWELGGGDSHEAWFCLGVGVSLEQGAMGIAGVEARYWVRRGGGGERGHGHGCGHAWEV